MSTRPEPEVGQTWIGDHDERFTIIAIKNKGDFPIHIQWESGGVGAWERDMSRFTPTPETLAAWNAKKTITISAPLPERWDWRPYALSAPRRVWHRRTDWRME